MAMGSSASSRQINRSHSPVLARSVPWLTVMLGSLLQTLPMISSAPLVPPLGFLALLAWRQLHPGLLPVWAGLPLGLVDDLFSGQPMGSAMTLWSLAMIAFDLIEQRFPWRSYLLDWAVAAAAIVLYLLASGLLAHSGRGIGAIGLLGPQLALSVLIFPLVERLIAVCDRVRLRRFRKVS
ncbi:MAG TPA: rod shape-determining protein MreD [Novosphingobium sp.]